MPRGLACEPAGWWQALLTFALTTGWRIEEILSLRRDDLDFASGAILTRAADNKGSRDDRDYLPAAVLELVKAVVGFEPVVFWWPHNERTLWSEFGRMQREAGIHLPCREEHDHTDACHVYGFHDLRRAFATMNADKLTADALMQHKSYLTTRRYVNMARQLNRAVEGLHVPDILRVGRA